MEIDGHARSRLHLGEAKGWKTLFFERSFWNEGTWNSCILLVRWALSDDSRRDLQPKALLFQGNTSRDYLGRSRIVCAYQTGLTDPASL